MAIRALTAASLGRSIRSVFLANSPTNPVLRLAAIRRLHSWIGVFIAPSVIFFAFTGIVQLFSLHESRGAYHPPALIEGLGSVHKNQIFRIRPPRPEPEQAMPAPASGAKAGGPADGGPADGDHVAASPRAKPFDGAAAKPRGQPLKVYALKWLFTLVGLGLMASTGLGLWMSLRYGRDRLVMWGLLAAGGLLPLLLVVI